LTNTPKRQLEYARPITQRGVTAITLEDGVRIVIPFAAVRRHPLNVFLILLEMIWRKIFGTALPESEPRALITVQDGRLTIRESHYENRTERSWPVDELTECRPNRFQRSLFVRIPGKEATDALEDLDEELLKFIADELRPHLPNVK
jgi:hypothetical protein